MMLYDYICDACGLEFEELNTIEGRYNAKCPSCNEPARKLVNTKLSSSIFPEGYWSNIDSHPIYVRSASHLAEECKKRWTPTNKPWPEYLDGVSQPGLPSEIKYSGAEGHPSKEELCRMKTERLNKMAEKVQLAKQVGLVTS